MMPSVPAGVVLFRATSLETTGLPLPDRRKQSPWAENCRSKVDRLSGTVFRENGAYSPKQVNLAAKNLNIPRGEKYNEVTRKRW